MKAISRFFSALVAPSRATVIARLNAEWAARAAQTPRLIESSNPDFVGPDKGASHTVFFLEPIGGKDRSVIQVRTLDWSRAGSATSARADEIKMDPAMRDSIMSDVAQRYPGFRFVPTAFGQD